jgi:hypothetical protein
MPERSNSARYLWGDRNPASVSIMYSATSVVPHGSTERATYTVPTAKKAQVSGAISLLFLTNVATTAGDRVAVVRVTIGATTYDLVYAAIYPDRNSVGNKDVQNVGQSYFLRAAEKIAILTADSSTGGTVTYNASVLATEYDA